MNYLRNFVHACFLSIVFTFPAFAGEIQNPGVNAPSTPPTESSIAGEIQNPGVTALMLDLVTGVLALL